MRKTYIGELSTRQSNIISTVKCLLVILVVFIHVLPDNNPPLDSSSSGAFLYSFVSELISHNISRIAVPCFFVFSGYFFYYSFDGRLSINWLKNKWRKRTRTLLIPYLTWNILLIVIILIKNNILCFGGIKDDFSCQLQDAGIYGALWGLPINIPLWYMRDLLCLSIIAPLLLFLFKYLKCFGLILLAIPYYLMIESGIPGFGTVSLLFFGIGAFMSLNRINIISFFKNFEVPAYCIALILLLTATFLSGTDLHEPIIRLFIPFGIISIINIVGRFKEQALENGAKLCSCSFFIYAAHWIYVRNWSFGLSSRIFNDTIFGHFFTYFFSSTITILFCAAVFFLMKRCTPKILKVLNGGRI